MMTPFRYVIIGSGLAGYGVARELRRVAPESHITVLTQDAGHFYSKPAISTALAKQKTADGLITMPAEKMMETLKIELRSHFKASAIDAAQHSVTDGDLTISYERLILATGAQPVRPIFTGSANSNFYCINDLLSYSTFRAALTPGARIAIIGAGLVGSEFANDLSSSAHSVVVVDPLTTPLGQLVPPQIGVSVQNALAAQGVDWRLGRTVDAIDHANEGYCLTLSDGQTIKAEIIISAVGLRPEVQLAQAAGLAINRGIIVDDHGRTSDPHIFALGDCAEYPHGLSAYVTPIMSAARAVAATASGNAARFAFPPLSVQVKITACPLVFLPPDRSTHGRWILDDRMGDALKYLFVDADGAASGYAMTGDFCSSRMDLDREIAAGTLRHVA